MPQLHVLFSLPLVDTVCIVYGFPFIVKITGYGALVLFSGVISFGLYITRLRNRALPPPISAWGLWFLTDAVATGSEFAHSVFNAQLVTYTIGASLICIVLLRRPQIAWDKVWDTLTSLTVVIAIIVWIISGDAVWGLWLSLGALWLAALPLMRELANRHILDEPLDSWLVVVAGTTINYFDGQVVSSVVLGVMQLVIVALIIRNKMKLYN